MFNQVVGKHWLDEPCVETLCWFASKYFFRWHEAVLFYVNTIEPGALSYINSYSSENNGFVLTTVCFVLVANCVRCFAWNGSKWSSEPASFLVPSTRILTSFVQRTRESISTRTGISDLNGKLVTSCTEIEKIRKKVVETVETTYLNNHRKRLEKTAITQQIT